MTPLALIREQASRSSSFRRVGIFGDSALCWKEDKANNVSHKLLRRRLHLFIVNGLMYIGFSKNRSSIGVMLVTAIGIISAHASTRTIALGKHDMCTKIVKIAAEAW